MALVASGPMMTCLELPNSAYMTMAPIATYNPATGVTPANPRKSHGRWHQHRKNGDRNNKFGTEQGGVFGFKECQTGNEFSDTFGSIHGFFIG